MGAWKAGLSPITDVIYHRRRDCAQFDDAVWVRRTAEGNFRLDVHIADVSYYVRPGSPIDREALLRGTSVYFPDRAVPMLPLELSTKPVLASPQRATGWQSARFFESTRAATSCRSALLCRQRHSQRRTGDLYGGPRDSRGRSGTARAAFRVGRNAGVDADSGANSESQARAPRLYRFRSAGAPA